MIKFNSMAIFALVLTSFISNHSLASTRDSNIPKLEAAPVNDAICDAITISCGDNLSGTNIEATSSSLGPPTCTGGTDNDVFYKFNATEGNTYTIAVSGADYDAVLALYSGSSCSATLTELACADNGIISGELETITYTATENTLIFIQTYDWSSDGGEFFITLICEFVNDDPCDAQLITCGENVNGSNVGATASLIGSPSCSTGSQRDVFYKIDAIAGIDYTVTVIGENYDGVLAAFTGSCTSTLTEIDCSDGGFGDDQIETIDFSVTLDGPVYIQTYDWENSGGDFVLNVSCANVPYDIPCEARDLVCGESFSGSSAGATQSALGAPTCASGSQKDVFFKFSALANVEYSVTVNGDNYDGVIAAYTGPCSGTLSEINCADENFSSGEAETVNILVPTDQVIIVQTYNYSSNGSADFTIMLDCLSDPSGLGNMNAFTFDLYPNPAKDRLFVEAPLPIESATLTNIIGQEVKAFAFTTSQNIELDLNEIDAGIYILQLSSSENKISTAKVVVE